MCSNLMFEGLFLLGETEFVAQRLRRVVRRIKIISEPCVAPVYAKREAREVDGF